MVDIPTGFLFLITGGSAVIGIFVGFLILRLMISKGKITTRSLAVKEHKSKVYMIEEFNDNLKKFYSRIKKYPKKVHQFDNDFYSVAKDLYYAHREASEGLYSDARKDLADAESTLKNLKLGRIIYTKGIKDLSDLYKDLNWLRYRLKMLQSKF